jgi:regulator of protease activity HflC (stomatin/prohibitin superfamily)
MDRCRSDRGIARQYAAPRQKITGPYFHLPDLLHRGAEVTVVELKDIQLSDTMKRAMARQAEAGKRAKMINAEGNTWPPPRWARPPTS